MPAPLEAGRRVAGSVTLALAPWLASAANSFEVEPYGELNATLQNSREASQDEVELQSNASNVGVRGESPLGQGLKLLYQLEWGFDYDGASGDGKISARNQFVALSSRLGTVKVGRHDTAFEGGAR